jgi:hypothetical protein
VADAITRVADSHAHTCDLEHPGTPSSSLAVLREHDQRVECLLLFDSVILLDGPSGLTVLTDAASTHSRSRSTWPLVSSPSGRRRTRSRCKNSSRHSGATATRRLLGRRREAGGRLSGGHRFLAAVVDWPELLGIMQHGPARVISRVREVEDADPIGTRWPRYKHSDDATAAFSLLR